MIGDVPMTEEKKFQIEVETLSAECTICQRTYQRAGIPFPEVKCKNCHTGISIRNLNPETASK